MRTGSDDGWGDAGPKQINTAYERWSGAHANLVPGQGGQANNNDDEDVDGVLDQLSKLAGRDGML